MDIINDQPIEQNNFDYLGDINQCQQQLTEISDSSDFEQEL